ncbi:MAG: SapC family protein [Hydrogenovibrio sp.]|uniref:SapC family protein n=1 Tax=Hydrogenovibrio sp. TaxID=2065821 RepID=UPI00286FE047|nr:SapC family protein [Hydrogenovibrio sp.]MDR9500016.1 SapC family protein [Hydrogenovibrio sp.]
MSYRPLSLSGDAGKGFLSEQNHKFSESWSFLPIVSTEFLRALPWFVFGFREKEGRLELGIVSGLRSGENLYFNSKTDQFEAPYVPAIIRQYPFKALRKENQWFLTVHTLESGFSELSDKPVIDVGGLTPYGRKVFQFTQMFQTQYEQDQRALAEISEADLLMPFSSLLSYWPESIRENIGLERIYTLNPKKYKTLSGPTLAQLQETNALPIIEAQRLSLGNLSILKSVFEKRKLEVQSSNNQGVERKNQLDLEAFFDASTDTLKF